MAKYMSDGDIILAIEKYETICFIPRIAIQIERGEKLKIAEEINELISIARTKDPSIYGKVLQIQQFFMGFIACDISKKYGELTKKMNDCPAKPTCLQGKNFIPYTNIYISLK